jgi:hypothetical protein
MAFSTLQVTPASVQLTLGSSLETSNANDAFLSFAPTVPGGTVLDLTPATSYTVSIDNGLQPGQPGYVATTPANTKISGSSTGGSLKIAASDWTVSIAALLYSLLNSGSGRLCVSATDGTNNIIVARGQYSYSPTA